MARKLAGGEPKEDKQAKLKRISNNKVVHSQFYTVALPSILGVLFLVFLLFFWKSNIAVAPVQE